MPFVKRTHGGNQAKALVAVAVCPPRHAHSVDCVVDFHDPVPSYALGRRDPVNEYVQTFQRSRH